MFLSLSLPLSFPLTLQAYAIAHRLETDSGSGSHHGVDSVPSPYARLNQLTLEMLASTGQPHQIARMIAMVKQAEQVQDLPCCLAAFLWCVFEKPNSKSM